MDDVDKVDPEQKPEAPPRLDVWREEIFAASNGARIVHRVPLGEPPPDFVPFSGLGDLIVTLPNGLELPPTALSFPLAGATDGRTAAELWPAAAEAAKQAELARVRQAVEELKQKQQSQPGLVLPGPGSGILPGQPGFKAFPPRGGRNGRGRRG